MSEDFEAMLDALEERGYGGVTRDDRCGRRASGTVPLPVEERRERPAGWRRFLPRVFDASDPALVPGEVREVVEAYGFRVQPVGRDADSVTLLVEPDFDGAPEGDADPP